MHQYYLRITIQKSIKYWFLSRDAQVYTDRVATDFTNNSTICIVRCISLSWKISRKNRIHAIRFLSRDAPVLRDGFISSKQYTWNFEKKSEMTSGLYHKINSAQIRVILFMFMVS